MILTNSVAIYSDLICPWCYIGKRRMEEALRHLLEFQSHGGAHFLLFDLYQTYKQTK